mmetsp:Transcript_20009/g.59615  ORF Transcript_20009/g.59615 Transcript_20009/m.59615 type:complete len:243 (+) Transcript_20009:404-1132(+)
MSTTKSATPRTPTTASRWSRRSAPTPRLRTTTSRTWWRRTEATPRPSAGASTVENPRNRKMRFGRRATWASRTRRRSAAAARRRLRDARRERIDTSPTRVEIELCLNFLDARRERTLSALPRRAPRNPSTAGARRMIRSGRRRRGSVEAAPDSAFSRAGGRTRRTVCAARTSRSPTTARRCARSSAARRPTARSSRPTRPAARRARSTRKLPRAFAAAPPLARPPPKEVLAPKAHGIKSNCS